MGKRWTNNKELNEMIDTVIAQGWTVRERNHLTLYPADKTQRPVIVPRTPSDHRGIKNARSEIRRSGGTV
ncbi:MAG: hypothetical protein ABMA25_16645 [Ilumatobacteraceae bacterium]